MKGAWDGKTVRYGAIGRIYAVLHTHAAPAQPEWNANLAALDAALATGEITKVFVYTRGGAPNANQRKAMNDVYGKWKQPDVVVVTPDMTTRAIVMTMNLFLKQPIRPFPPDRVHHAYAEMGLSKEEIAQLDGLLAEHKDWLV